MSIGSFLDKNHKPTEDEIRAALGNKITIWERLVRFLLDNYQLPPELSYGGKNYGWNLWYRKSGKSLLSLYPQQDGLVAQVVLGREQVEKAMGLDLGLHVGQMLRDTPQLHDGKWLFITLQDEADADAVEKLLLVKRKAKKQVG